MKMKQILRYILPIVSLLLVSCHGTIHEHPDAGDASVSLTMRVKTSGPELFTVVEYTGNSRVQYKSHEFQFPNSRTDLATQLSAYLSKNTVDLKEWDMRLVWELYEGTRDDIKKGKANLLQRSMAKLDYALEMPDHTINFMAPSGRYTLLAWCDFVPKNTVDDYYYDTQNMNALISDLDKRRACVNNDQRDCFAQAYDFEIKPVEYYGQPRHYETTLIRPQGRYVVLATDYDRYLELSGTPVESNRSCITYPSFINVGYSVLEERPNESTTGMTYCISPRLYEFDNQTAVCVGDDYSFVNGEVSHVHININVYHVKGNQLSFNKNIDIPLYPDKLTVVIGKFLATSGGSGGISIDDKFEGEIVVPYATPIDFTNE